MRGRALRRLAALALVSAENLTGPGGLPYTIPQGIDPECQQPCVPTETMDLLETLDGGNLVDAMGITVLLRSYPSPS